MSEKQVKLQRQTLFICHHLPAARLAELKVQHMKAVEPAIRQLDYEQVRGIARAFFVPVSN